MRLPPSYKIYEKKKILEKSRLTDVSILCKFLKCLLTIATLHNAQMQCDVIRFLKSVVSNQIFEIIFKIAKSIHKKAVLSLREHLT